MANERAVSLSIKSLSVAVDNAVKQVESHRLALTPEFRIDLYIMGRWLREEIALKDAVAIAQQIAEHVQANHIQGGGSPASATSAQAGPQLQPAVLARGGHVICGFVVDPRVSFTAE